MVSLMCYLVQIIDKLAHAVVSFGCDNKPRLVFSEFGCLRVIVAFNFTNPTKTWQAP